MQFLPLALSWDWVATNAAAIAAGSTMVSLFIVYLYRIEIHAAMRRRKIGIKLGLIDQYEQDALLRREKLQALLERLKVIFKRTKERSGRLPQLEAFDLDPEKALKGREKKFSLIMDQIKRIALRVTQLEDINEILEIRVLLDAAVKDLGTISTSDEMAVDNQEAVNKLNDLLTDLDEAVAEIERAEDEAMDDALNLAEWALETKPSEEEQQEETSSASREPLEEALRRSTAEPTEDELLVPEDDEEGPPLEPMLA